MYKKQSQTKIRLDLKWKAKENTNDQEEQKNKGKRHKHKGKEERGKRDGTGPYKDSWQRKNRKEGRRIEAGEECPEEE